MKERRRLTYSMSARLAPSFTDQIPLREQHRSHPMVNFSYSELLDVFGGSRNLGINVNTFYSENAVGFFQTDRDYQNTTTQPAYVWSYQTFDNYNNRKQQSASIKADYRVSATTRISVSGTASDNIEHSRRRYITRAYSSQDQNTVPSATTSVVPGWTDKITVIRPVVAPTGILASNVLSFITANLAAGTPLNETDRVPVKPVPVRVTTLPTRADAGENSVKVGTGEGLTVNPSKRATPPGVVTVMGPLVAPAGTPA